MARQIKIGLGGGCHWCTEAVFQSLIGVLKVEQGYVASEGVNNNFSEAVVVHFSPDEIKLQVLIEIHLHTHKSTSNHSMRNKYRSAIYVYSEAQLQEVKHILNCFQLEFRNELVTQVLPFKIFKASREAIQNYYQKNSDKPFCETYINPKLRFLLKEYSSYTNKDKFLIKTTTNI